MHGLPSIENSKVSRVLTDEFYRNAFYKSNLPDQEFYNLYLDAIRDNSSDNLTKFSKAQRLFEITKGDISLKGDYRISIRSRNLLPKRHTV